MHRFAHTHMHKHAYTQAHVHICMHTYLHTHMCPHTHTPLIKVSVASRLRSSEAILEPLEEEEIRAGNQNPETWALESNLGQEGGKRGLPGWRRDAVPHLPCCKGSTHISSNTLTSHQSPPRASSRAPKFHQRPPVLAPLPWGIFLAKSHVYLYFSSGKWNSCSIHWDAFGVEIISNPQ